jgi:hypothetical protein
VFVVDAASSLEHITADSWRFWNGSEWCDAKGALVSPSGSEIIFFDTGN